MNTLNKQKTCQWVLPAILANTDSLYLFYIVRKANYCRLGHKNGIVESQICETNLSVFEQ